MKYIVKFPQYQFNLGGGKLKFSKFALILFCGFFIQITVVSAQETEAPVEDPLLLREQGMALSDTAAGPLPPAGPSVWNVIRMIITLALVAAAVYGIVFLFKKASRRPESKDPFLKVLASAPLGYNRYAHVVSVGSKAWLLGSSDGGVNLIGEVDDRDVLNAMLQEDSRKSDEAAASRFPDFTAMLRRLGVPAQQNAPGADNIRRRRERLKGL